MSDEKTKSKRGKKASTPTESNASKDEATTAPARIIKARTIAGEFLSGITAIAVTPDSKYIVTGSDGGVIKVWDLETGECLRHVQAHEGYADRGDPDDLYIDRERIIDWLGHILSIAVSPDGTHIVSVGDDGKMKIWDLKSLKRIRTVRVGFILDLTVSPDNMHVVSGSGHGVGIYVWEIDTGKNILKLKGDKHSGYTAVMTPDGKRIVSDSYNECIIIWDFETGKCLRTIDLKHLEKLPGIIRLAITSDGARIISGFEKGGIKIWDIMTGECLKTIDTHEHEVKSIAITPDGKLLVSGGNRGVIKIWDLVSGECLRTIQAHKFDVIVVMTPDGKHFISTGATSEDMKIWNMIA